MFIQSGNYFFILLYTVPLIATRIEECMHSLNNYVEKNFNPYQVVLLTNPNAFSIERDIIASVLRNLPYFRIDIEKMSSEDLMKSMKHPSFGIPRETSLFLLVTSTPDYKSSSISPSLNYLTNLTPAKSRPKTLLISLTKRKSSYQEFLHQMWLKLFLDLTILEIQNKHQEQNFIHGKQRPFVHYYNPFAMTYSRKVCSAKTDWFPNKLLNLRGYLIRSGLHLKPPFSLPTYDKAGRLTNSSGVDVQQFYTLSEAMNFTTHIDSNVNSTIGVVVGNKATGMFKKLMNNEIGILITSNINIRPAADGALYEYSSTIEMESMVALIPITHTNTEEEYLSVKNLFSQMFFFVTFVIIMWKVLSNYKNGNNFWKPEYIAAIILGTAIHQQPINFGNRIFFIYLIAIGFYCSISFLAGLTATKFSNSNEVAIDTFIDLAKSPLFTMISPNIYRLLGDDSEDVKLLKEKMIPDELVDTECISTLVKHKNVSCIILTAYARQLVELLRDADGNPLSKVLKQNLFNVRRTVVLERSTPYKPRIDKLIGAIVQSGLRTKWANNISNHELLFDIINYKKRLIKANDVGAVSKLKTVLLLVLILCYFLSLLVFAGEVLRKYLALKVSSFQLFGWFY